jgi:hypothetical protein
LNYRANTIDTFRHVQLQTVQNKKKGTTTLAAPALLINRKSCLDDGRLYINSSVRGVSEVGKVFYGGDAIDVYYLHDGKYIESFYVPHFQGKSLKDFQVNGKYLYALYDDFITLSEL